MTILGAVRVLAFAITLYSTQVRVSLYYPIMYFAQLLNNPITYVALLLNDPITAHLATLSLNTGSQKNGNAT